MRRRLIALAVAIGALSGMGIFVSTQISGGAGAPPVSALTAGAAAATGTLAPATTAPTTTATTTPTTGATAMSTTGSGSAPVSAAALAGAGYASLTPARLADTRPGSPTIDGQSAGTGLVASGTTLELTVAGRGGIPANADTAVLNITSTGATGTGYVTVWPCGQDRPLASSLNFAAGRDVANAVITKLGSGGKICLFAGAAGTHLVVDATGSFAAGAGYASLTPARLADTRPGSPTIDGQSAGTGLVASGTTLELTVAGRGGIPANADTAVLNITSTGATGTGYVTVWPCGQDRPLASSLNFAAGRDVANAVITKLGSGGKICLFAGAAGTHLVVDATGSFAAGAGYASLTPARLADTRPGSPTIDGQSAGTGLVASGTTLELTVAGRGGIPANADTAVLNITSTGATGTGYVTVWPCGQDRPLASSLNFAAGRDVANAVITKLGSGGKICLFAGAAGTHLVVDATGSFPAGAGGGGGGGGGGTPPPPRDCSARPSLVQGVWTSITPPGVPIAGNPPFGVNDVQFAASDPCVLFATIDSAGLYKSTNGGTSWDKVGNLDSPLHVRIDPRDPNHLYGVQGVRGSTLGFWVSHDGGNSFTTPPAFASGAQTTWTGDVAMVEVDPDDFNHLLITFHGEWKNQNGDSGILESTDGGNSFKPIFQPGWGHGLWPMFVGDSPRHWLLGTSEDGYWQTTDAGATWTQVYPESMAHSGTQLYKSKANGALYMGAWNGILRSTDNGASWTKLDQSNGISYCSYYSAYGDGKRIYTQCAFTGTNAQGKELPYLVTAEGDGLSWAPYNSQTFVNGPSLMSFDATNGIMYSSNGSAGVLAMKVPA